MGYEGESKVVLNFREAEGGGYAPRPWLALSLICLYSVYQIQVDKFKIVFYFMERLKCTKLILIMPNKQEK